MSLAPVAFWPGPILSDVISGKGVVGACELPVVGKDLKVTIVGVSGVVASVALWSGSFFRDIIAVDVVVGPCELPVVGKDLMVTVVGKRVVVVVVVIVVVVVMLVLFLTYNDAERMLML